MSERRQSELETPPRGTPGLPLPEIPPIVDPLLGAILQNYRVVERIAEGGMGVVYRAEHVTLKRRAALKVLKPEHSTKEVAVKRFYQEGQLVTQLQHPNIVDIFDFGLTDDHRVYYAMELLEGESLANRIETRGPLSLQEAAPILKQAAGALHAAHQRGIIHRDLKPENLWLCSNGITKLLDFGIAKLVGIEDVQDKLTKTGMIVGTPHYMSPEQINGSHVDARSDVYSLGLVLYEALSGKSPFQDQPLGDILAAHILGDLKGVTSTLEGMNIPLGAKALIFRALARDPNDRYQNMREMIDDLIAIEAGKEPRGGRKALARRGKRSSTAALVGAGLAGAAAVVGLWWAFSSPPLTPPPPASSAPAVVRLDDAALRAKALDRLQQALQDPAPRARAAAAAALGRVQDRGSRGRIEALLADPDPQVRAAAARGLGMLGVMAAAPALRAAREDAQPQTRAALEAALLRLGDAEAAARLAPLATGADPSAAQEAASALAEDSKPEGLPALQALSSAELPAEERLALAASRARAGDSAARGALLQGLSAEDPTATLQAAAALAQAGDDAGAEVLRAALKAPTEEARVLAASALAWLGEPDGREVLRAALRAEAAPVRQRAARALSSFMADPELARDLELLLSDPDTEAQIEAAAAIVLLLRPSEASDGLAWLDEALQTEDPRNRARALALLDTLPAEQAVPRLRAAMEDPDQEVAATAARGLARAAIDLRDARAAETLSQFVDNSRGAVRVFARAAQPGEEGRRAIQDALKSKDPTTRGAAVEAAAQRGETDLLVGLLKDKDAALRLRAARALALRGDERGKATLRKSLNSKDPSLKQAAADALLATGEDVGQDLNEIETLLASPALGDRLMGLAMLDTLPPEQAAAARKRALRAPEEELRLAAVAAAAKAGDRALLLRAQRDLSPAVRAAAGLALMPPTEGSPASTSAPATSAPAEAIATPLPASVPATQPEEPTTTPTLSDDDAAKRKRDARLKLSQAELSLKAGKAGDALRLFKETHALAPQPDIQWFYGLCYQALGNGSRETEKRIKNWSLARDAFDKFSKKFPADPRSAKAKAYARELDENIKSF